MTKLELKLCFNCDITEACNTKGKHDMIACSMHTNLLYHDICDHAASAILDTAGFNGLVDLCHLFYQNEMHVKTNNKSCL